LVWVGLGTLSSGKGIGGQDLVPRSSDKQVVS
jgi:hypothetical protein